MLGAEMRLPVDRAVPDQLPDMSKCSPNHDHSLPTAVCSSIKQNGLHSGQPECKPFCLAGVDFPVSEVPGETLAVPWLRFTVANCRSGSESRHAITPEMGEDDVKNVRRLYCVVRKQFCLSGDNDRTVLGTCRRDSVRPLHIFAIEWHDLKQ
jgi:hypothetical protein